MKDCRQHACGADAKHAKIAKAHKDVSPRSSQQSAPPCGICANAFGTRYEKYKQTGIPWLPEAPESWDVKKLHQFCSEGKTRNKGNVVSNVLSLSYGNIIRKKDVYSGLTPTDFSTYQIVEEDYVVLRLTDLQNDHKSLRCGFVRERGIITSAYVSLIPKGIFPAYLYKILHVWDLLKAFYSMGGGLRQSLKFSELSNIKILVPPLPEQRAIVAYLDDKCGKIDELVAAKEKEVELLKELKQTVIADAVTKGVSNAPLRDSGIPWLPQIPEGWEVKQLRSLLKMVSVKGCPDKQLLSVTREQGVIVRNIESKEENHNYIPEDLSNYKLVEQGDFAINKMKSWQGSYGVSDYEGIVSPAYYVCKLSGVDKKFFSTAIRSRVYVSFFARFSKGIRVDQWDLSPVGLKTIPFFLPPLDEQREIVAYIEEKTAKIDQAVAGLTQQVAALKEYKQRLIADVVTGQMRVA